MNTSGENFHKSISYQSCSFFRPLLNVYPLDLGATEAQQTTIASMATLPAAFKILYGFVSDNVLLCGYRRKSYMLLGWLLAFLIMAALTSRADLTLTYDSATGEAIPPIHAPSLTNLSFSFFLYGTSLWWADVMADSLVAQKARLEPDHRKGELQSSCYAARFFGMMVSAPVSTYLYSHNGPGSVIACLKVIPLSMVPLIYFLREERLLHVIPTETQLAEIWRSVCSRSVWQPMAFVYIFNLLQVSNGAWRQFLKTVLNFDASMLNDLLVASYVLLSVGTMFYKYFLLKTSWRLVYRVCIILNAFFSILQLLLIRGNTFGLSPFVFAFSDESLAEFVDGIQFLPVTIMMAALCPPGSEGASYAMFTTISNSGKMISPALSSLLLGIWDTSKEAFERGDLDGLYNLSVLTTVIQLSPILILNWFPGSRLELKELGKKPYSGSRIGGALFLLILFLSMACTLSVGILNILKPGWSGGS